MQVTMVDPSLFTPQYDGPLVEALRQAVDVELVGRRERADQVRAGVAVVPHFYRWSERLRGGPAAPLAAVVKPFEHVSGWLRLLVRLRRRSADVLHVQWAVLPLVDAAAMRWARRRRPVVLTVHNTTPLHGGGSVVQRLGTRQVLQAADRVVVHTEHSRQSLIGDGVAPERIVVVPHGPLEAGAPVTDQRAADGPTRLLLFGKVRPYKGLDVLIEALGRLDPAQRAQVSLTVAGDPMMDLAPLTARAAELGVDGLITWRLGFVDEATTAELLGTHHVMVLPYRDVDGSGVLALAQQAGMAVVASRVGGFGELLAGSGAATLVEPGQPGPLAEAIAAFGDLGERRRRLEAAAAERASRPGWDEAARLIHQLYLDLLRTRAH